MGEKSLHRAEFDESSVNAPEPLRIWDQNANRGRGDVYVNFCPTKTQDWRLVPGQTYELRYRVLTYDGSLDPERAERLWQEYVSSGAARHTPL